MICYITRRIGTTVVVFVVFSIITLDALSHSNCNNDETMFNMLHDVDEEKLINDVCSYS